MTTATTERRASQRPSRELVAINSVNPALVPGMSGERAITDFASDWLTGRGGSCGTELFTYPAECRAQFV
jgi:hypothetical protein